MFLQKGIRKHGKTAERLQEESVKNLAVLLQIYTGMRVGELTALKPEDNKSKQCLHICRTEYLISIAGKRVNRKRPKPSKYKAFERF